MRLYEFADAEAQLALLRTIIDNTWTAISQQAEQERRVEAERKSQSKPKQRGRKSSKGSRLRLSTPPKPPQAPLAKQLPTPLDKASPQALNAVKPIPSANPQLKQTLASTSVKPKLSSMPYPKLATNTPIKPHYGVKDGYLGKNTGTSEKELDGDDRHSENGIASPKK
jgi:hypothetical protein